MLSLCLSEGEARLRGGVALYPSERGGPRGHITASLVLDTLRHILHLLKFPLLTYVQPEQVQWASRRSSEKNCSGKIRKWKCSVCHGWTCSVWILNSVFWYLFSLCTSILKLCGNFTILNVLELSSMVCTDVSNNSRHKRPETHGYRRSLQFSNNHYRNIICETPTFFRACSTSSIWRTCIFPFASWCPPHAVHVVPDPACRAPTRWLSGRTTPTGLPRLSAHLTGDVTLAVDAITVITFPITPGSWSNYVKKWNMTEDEESQHFLQNLLGKN